MIQWKQPLFAIEKVCPNLDELALNDKDAMRILNDYHHQEDIFHNIEILHLPCFQKTPIMFLSDLLGNFPNVTTLHVSHSSFQNLFPSERIGDHYSTKSPIIQIKKLWLYQLEQIKHIWNHNNNDNSLPSNPLLQNLEVLREVECSSLISLVSPPSSIAFKSLTTLKVKDCKKLIFLMTPSIAKSLVNLKRLTVSNCEMIEEVMMNINDEGESESEEEEEIRFGSLEYLKLSSLSNFKSFFCSGQKHSFIFPSLEELIVTECPKMQNFSSGTILAPMLTAVRIENKGWRWKEDLNTTIKQIFMEKKKVMYRLK
ncbi:putative leucine-rich repeat domain, L domain-containing protein [Senna tora]|uniref:Putative leucine-rich repeat domain, L domain-containing protein n=1 Tax=Senna tora TaxID=362788 RepID=A0A834XIL0_9FABA|nr:putative leucine-rich repeat domain, L domain-containing protein [Senna tora]